MDLVQLQQLKQKLLHDKELAPVWSFFMDQFADHPEFIALGERAHHAFVEAVIVEVSQQLFGKDGKVRGLLMTRLAEHDFVHGGFSMGGRIGGVIYFEDEQKGLLAVTAHPPSNEVKYARFSGQVIARPGGPSRN